MEYSIDQQQDYSNRELYSFLSGHDLPQYVKEAELDSVFAGSLEKTAFADDLGRKFPINSKANIFVSNAFLINKKAGLEKLRGALYVTRVAQQINKVAAALGIASDLKKYNEAVAVKEAEDYTDRTIKVKLGEDEIDLFSIKTSEQLVDGANNFVRDIERFPYSWRRSISEQFVKAAEELGLDEIPDIIAKYAGMFYPDVVAVKTELHRRSVKLAGEDKENYIKVAEDLDNTSSIEEFFKLAEYCYQTEKKAGLYNVPYNKKVLGDPVNRFFTLSLDKVAELMDTVTMAGERYATEDLAKVSADIYEKAFGFEIDPKTAEARDVLPTMPKSDVELFKKLSGVKPI